MGFHRRKSSLTGSGAPTGVATPEYVGQLYIDIALSLTYVSKGSTVNDWVFLGDGDMRKDIYDVDDDGLIDNAEQLNDGVNISTALEVRTHLDNPYGTEFQYAENLVVSTSTNNAYLTKLLLTTTALIGGTYKISYSYGWNHNSVQNDFQARLLLDGLTGINNLLMIHRQEPKDSAGTGAGRYSSTGSNQYYKHSGSIFLILTAGVHTIRLDYSTQISGVASSIWDAHIELMRVL